MKQFWEERFQNHKFAYGKEPNLFFREQIEKCTRGSLLLPAEGEGRNAIYAAKLGWDVHAFDFSETAKNNALNFAKENDVTINYTISTFEDFEAKTLYDAIACIFVHMPQKLHITFFQKLISSLKPGGIFIFEAFSKNQIHNNTGGPKDEALLYSEEELLQLLSPLHIDLCKEHQVSLNEGQFHSGKSDLISLIATKK